jgi:hypothetical protein
MNGIARRTIRALGIVAVAAAIAAGTAGDAGAISPPVSGGPGGSGTCASQAGVVRGSPTVESLRAFGACEISRRQATLAQLSKVIDGSRALASADAAALRAAVSSASSELVTLESNLDSETTIPALKATIVQIVSRVRVYVLLVPQVRLTVAADDVLSLQPHLAALSSTLADRVAAARAAGKDVGVAQSALDAMNAALAKAQTLAAPWPARLVALTPADFDSGVAGPVLTRARAALGDASVQLKTAVAEGRAVLRALR